MRIGLISDTHDLVRPEARSALLGCDKIIHAGDFCSGWVLGELARIAPVTAVRGNGDRGAWADSLPSVAVFTLGEIRGLVIHDLSKMPESLDTSEYGLIVYGHSHSPSTRRSGGTLFINPGSAGPRRFSLPISIGILNLTAEGEMIPELLTLG